VTEEAGPEKPVPADPGSGLPTRGKPGLRKMKGALRRATPWLPAGSGLLLLLSYPPVGASGLAWVALIPLLWAAFGTGASEKSRARGQKERRFLWLSFAGGLLWGAGLFYPLLFISEGTAAERAGGTAVIALLTGVILALFAGSALATERLWALGPGWIGPLLLASAWVCAEYLMRAVAAGFSSYLGVTQWRSPAMLAVASYGGVYGVAWLIVAANAVLARLLAPTGKPWERGGARPSFLRRSQLLSRANRPAGRCRSYSLLGSEEDGGGFGEDCGAAGDGWSGEAAGREGARWFLIAIGAATLLALVLGGQVGPVRRLGSEASGITAAVASRDESPLQVLLVQPFIVPEEYRKSRSAEGQRELWRRTFDQAQRALQPLADRMAAPGESMESRKAREAGTPAPSPAGAVETLVIMPETVVHVFAWDDSDFRETIVSFARSLGVHWLGGLPRPYDPEWDGPAGRTDGRERNSAFYVDREGLLRHVYDKVYVIPIAEKQFAPGRYAGVFRVGDHTAGVGICSDVVAPDHALATARAGASSLHYIASLGHTGSIVHLEQAFVAFRAAEHGLYVTQTATTGFTLIADAAGRVIARAKAEGPDELFALIPAKRRSTPYTLLGDWVPLVSAVALTLAGLAGGRLRENSMWRRKERRTGGVDES